MWDIRLSGLPGTIVNILNVVKSSTVWQIANNRVLRIYVNGTHKCCIDA